MPAISGGNLRTHDLRLAAAAGLVTVAALAALSLILPMAVRADDTKMQVPTRLAAADGAADPMPYRLGMPLPRIDLDLDLDLDLKLLLVQHRPAATKTDATADDTILVAVDLAVPQSDDEDIAKQYGLELLDRTELPDLGLRIVQFRASGNRATTLILADLRNDARIRRAQQNAQYRAQPPGKPAPAISRLNGPAPEAKAAKLAPVRTRPERTPQAIAKVTDRVGDVLSGGL